MPSAASSAVSSAAVVPPSAGPAPSPLSVSGASSPAGSALAGVSAERRAIAASIALSRSSSDISSAPAGSSPAGAAGGALWEAPSWTGAAGEMRGSCGAGGAISSSLPVSAATCGTTGMSGPPCSTHSMARRSRAPSERRRAWSRSCTPIEETTVVRPRARVITVARALRPPGPERGPKRCSSRPCGVLPKPTETRMSSRTIAVAWSAGSTVKTSFAPGSKYSRSAGITETVFMIRSMRRRACSSVKVSTARDRSGRLRACSMTRSVTRRSSASVLSTYSMPSVTGPRPFSTVTRRSCSGAMGLGTATTSPSRARRWAKPRSPSVAGCGSRRISTCGAIRSMSSSMLGAESPPYSSGSPTTTVCAARTIEGSAAAVGRRPPSATISTSKWRPRGITCGTR